MIRNIKDFLKKIIELISPKLSLRLQLLISSYLEDEIKLVPILSSSNLISLDIGAYVGIYTFYMLKYSKSLYAFEPNPNVFEILKKVFNKKVVLENVALSNVNGQAELKIPINYQGLATIEKENNFGNTINTNSIFKIIVRTRTLDSYKLSGVSFIKIDVEGHEQAVLEGAIETLKTNRPAILVEIDERHKSGSVKKIENFLGNLGYKGFFLDEKKIIPIKNFSIKFHQNTKNTSWLKKPTHKYLKNFIFINNLEAEKKITELNNFLNYKN